MIINYQQELDELLLMVAQGNASDLHLGVGRKPTLRIDGALVSIEKKEILTPKDCEGLVFALLSEEQKERFLREKEIDFSYSHKDKVRFRVNVFFQRGFISAALRLIPARIKTIEELNLPPICHEFSQANQGFVLVVGPSGHGKSTTLAALIDEINHTRTDHIVTIEDPIEYLFIQDRAIVNQREVILDTYNFHNALRSVFRQDPDVIMIGEMRDYETMSAAITAAETGHLVFASLHTNNASQTVDRIIDSFPASQQNQIRSQLAATLLGVISQRLIPRIEGGRIPASEIMISCPAVSSLIREGKTHELNLVIETNTELGMIALNRSLVELVKRREISMENALIYSLNPSELRSRMKKQY
ncbi:MAG: type IV pili twitching motility protein PilT [Parcubacteria group bacterium CG11_big_fil_rev_8_21_14_0_20_39_14]|nr:MAG: type IV pili twitching motility protein PilT [Parcubacteria group bacterium CG11_big_fil_rev_8_21_14_0_20_39_14]PIS35764.1 MAG: type IV pili twitching motility protein PilT [Parcubacteria group bacterium CG08_land_8_20_14_0_20_38_56]